MSNKAAHCSEPSMVLSSSSLSVIVAVITYLVVQDKMNGKLIIVTAFVVLVTSCCSAQVVFSCYGNGRVNIIKYFIDVAMSLTGTLV